MVSLTPQDTFCSARMCGITWEPYESSVHLPAEFSSPISRNTSGHSAMSQSAGCKFLVGAKPLARSVEMNRADDLLCEVPTGRIMHPLLGKKSCNSSCGSNSAWGYRTGSICAGRLVNTYAKVLVAINVA